MSCGGLASEETVLDGIGDSSPSVGSGSLGVDSAGLDSAFMVERYQSRCAVGKVGSRGIWVVRLL